MHKQHQAGVTAFELMVTMAIVAVLLSVGVPSVRHYTWNLRMRTAMDSLRTDMNLARGYAISHNSPVIVCPATNSSDCSRETSWQHGWIVFSDFNGDRRRQPGEPLIKHNGAVGNLHISSSRARRQIRFFANGSAPGSNVSIRFCDKRGARFAARLVVSNTGRIRSETGGLDPFANCP